MKLSKERKIFVGLLILALSAVFIDRVVIGSDVTEPQQVEAGALPTQPVSGERSAAAPFDNALHSPGHSGPSIGDRLSKVAQTQSLAQAGVRDAFAPSSKAWADELGFAQSGPGQAPFQDRHHLVAVIVADGEHYVIIDDQTLGVGNTLDGYTLVEVNDRIAVLESNGHRVELEIPSGTH